MDQCLRIPELVRLIHDDLGKGSSLSLALACKAFLEPGLDRIWHDLESLDPLVCCLPANLWKNNVGKLLTLRTTLTQEHLQRYLSFYAHRIHSLEAYSPLSKKGYLTGEALQALQLATNHEYGVLSPRLTHFTWNSPGDFAFRFHEKGVPKDVLDPYVSLFLGDTVKSLRLGAPRSSPLYAGSLISSTRRLAPHLQKLQLGPNAGIAFTTWYLSSFSLGTLEDVSLACVSSEILTCLAKAPLLHRLNILDSEGTVYNIPLSQAPAPSSFPSLRMLSLVAGSLSEIKKLLHAAGPKNKIEEVVANALVPVDFTECQETITAIVDHCNPSSLLSIEIRDARMSGLLIDRALDMYLEPSEQDLDISHLSQFPNLRKLIVSWQKGIQLSSREIALIPTWWPHLQNLDLRPSRVSQGRMPSINHTDLIDLVRGLPSLTSLGLRFDTTQIPGQTQEPIETFRLKTLAVGESPIVSPSRVAAFIKRHFPQLEELDVKREKEVEGEETILDLRWALVVRALRR